jgi:hypothetical protein
MARKGEKWGASIPTPDDTATDTWPDVSNMLLAFRGFLSLSFALGYQSVCEDNRNTRNPDGFGFS